MPEGSYDRYTRWDLAGLLSKYPALRIVPSPGLHLILEGIVEFHVRGPVAEPVEDRYSIRIRVRSDFPQVAPTVWETEGRIADDFHKLDGGALCLGAPAALRLGLRPGTTLPHFVERFLLPYLFGHAHFVRHGVMPFGELDHGPDGLRKHFAALFGAPDADTAGEFVRLASIKRRRANKVVCPCRSGRRLGRCHHRRVNTLRERLGRIWLRKQHAELWGSDRAVTTVTPVRKPRRSKSS